MGLDFATRSKRRGTLYDHRILELLAFCFQPFAGSSLDGSHFLKHTVKLKTYRNLAKYAFLILIVLTTSPNSGLHAFMVGSSSGLFLGISRIDP